MDFAYSPRVLELREQLWDFMNTQVLPAEERYFAEFSAATVPHHISPVMEELKARGAVARAVEPVPPRRALRRRPDQPRVRAAR